MRLFNLKLKLKLKVIQPPQAADSKTTNANDRGVFSEYILCMLSNSWDRRKVHILRHPDLWNKYRRLLNSVQLTTVIRNVYISSLFRQSQAKLIFMRHRSKVIIVIEHISHRWHRPSLSVILVSSVFYSNYRLRFITILQILKNDIHWIKPLNRWPISYSFNLEVVHPLPNTPISPQ